MPLVINERIGLRSNNGVEMAQSNSSLRDFLNSSRDWISNLAPLCFIIGVICDVTSIRIFRKSSMLSSTNLYLLALSVFDLLYQIFSFTMSWKYYHAVGTTLRYWSYTPFGLWLTEALRATSIWIIVSFTVERYIAVYHPLKRQIYCTEKRAKKAIIFAFVSCFSITGIFSFKWRGAIKPIPEYPINETVYRYTLDSTDAWKQESYQNTYNWISMVTFFLIPVLILAVSNFFLIQYLRNTERAPAVVPHQRVYSVSLWQLNDNQITQTVIGVSIVYILFQLPTNLLAIFTLAYNPTSRSADERILLELRNIFNLLGRFNPIFNFLIYMALNKDYRKYIYAMFLRQEVRNLNTNNTPRNTRVRYSVGSRLSGPARANVELCNVQERRY